MLAYYSFVGGPDAYRAIYAQYHCVSIPDDIINAWFPLTNSLYHILCLEQFRNLRTLPYLFPLKTEIDLYDVADYLPSNFGSIPPFICTTIRNAKQVTTIKFF